jgi:hypothetical protein
MIAPEGSFADIHLCFFACCSVILLFGSSCKQQKMKSFASLDILLQIASPKLYRAREMLSLNSLYMDCQTWVEVVQNIWWHTYPGGNGSCPDNRIKEITPIDQISDCAENIPFILSGASA